MSRLRFGVIGCGGIAQMMHIPHLAAYDEKFEIVALSDTHEPTLTAVADRYHVTKRYTDWRALIADPSVEAIGIFHGGSHFETALAAIQAGKHVFIEKPMGWNLREVEALAEAARQSTATIQVGYHKLYDPGFQYAKEQVEKMQELGYVRITVLHPDDPLGWSTHRVHRGNGVIIEGHNEPGDWDSTVSGTLNGLAGGALSSLVDEALGDRKDDARLRVAYGMMTVSLIHQVYTLHGFLGAPQEVVFTDVWRDGLSINSLIKYSDHLHVSLDWQFLSHLKDYREEYAFFGNHERVYFQLPSPYMKNFPSPVIVQGHDGELTWEKKVIVNYDEAFRNEILAFYDNITQNKVPISNVEEAVKHARMIQMMIDAAR